MGGPCVVTRAGPVRTLRALLLPVVTMTACGDASPSPVHIPAATVRDSAGIRIVEAGPVEDLPTVRVGRRPLLRTGWRDDEPTFEVVRSGVLVPDGGAVVADGRARRLWFVDEDGETRPLGRQGDGPGEFRYIEAVVRYPDGRLAAWDDRLNRLTLLAPDGQVLSTHLMADPGRVNVAPFGVLDSATLGWLPTSFGARPGADPSGWLQGPLVRRGPDDEAPDTVARVPIVLLEADGSRDPFTRYGMGDVAAGGFVWGTNDRAELRWYAGDGALREIWRWSQDPVEVTPEVWREYEAAFRERMGSSPEAPPTDRMARILEEDRENASSHLPFFVTVHAAPSGQVWLGEYTGPGIFPARYLEISADGRPLRWIEFETAIRVLDMDGNRILGVQTDEWDIQSVAIFEIPG